MIQPIIAPSELVEQAASWSQADGQIVPIYVNNDNLLSMNTPDHNETLAAQELCVTAIQAVKQYTFDPGDFEAATVALLARSIELTIKKELILCYQQKPTISNN